MDAGEDLGAVDGEITRLPLAFGCRHHAGDHRAGGVAGQRDLSYCCAALIAPSKQAVDLIEQQRRAVGLDLAIEDGWGGERDLPTAMTKQVKNVERARLTTTLFGRLQQQVGCRYRGGIEGVSVENPKCQHG